MTTKTVTYKFRQYQLIIDDSLQTIDDITLEGKSVISDFTDQELDFFESYI